LDFDIEKQFVNPDLLKLNQLAKKHHANVIMPNQIETLIKSLLADNQYKSIEKAVIKKPQ